MAGTADRRVRARAGASLPSYERPEGSAFARLYRGETTFDFINRWRYWFALSGAVIAIGLVALGVRGLNFSIDFRGGIQWQVPTTASVATVKTDLNAISPVLNKSTITRLTNRASGKTEISVEAPSSLTSNKGLVDKVTRELASIAHVTVDKVNLTAVGPSWGGVITKKAVEAVVVFLVLITLAISVYFEAKMAIGALVALLHDMLVTVGIYALSGFQVSPDTVIAFLTVLGYSIYDTIVVFDKIKENTRGLASTNRVTYTDVVNLSMNQVLARSINTSFVAVMPVFCILVIGSWVLGASALNAFGLALFIGLVSGAYSSIFIASPVLALLKEREPRYVEIRRRLAAYPQARQVLTPATVAGGSLVGPKLARDRDAVARGTVAPAGPGAKAPAAWQGADNPGPSETPALTSREPGPVQALEPEYGDGPVTSTEVGAVTTVGGGVGSNGGALETSDNKPGRGRASGSGAGAGGDAGAGSPSPASARARASGGRQVPPRPRPKKKVPRRR
jgi:preprotein translocase subunit SecF